MNIDGLRIHVAASFFQRLTGLLGRRALAPDEGLLLTPCSNIHTAFMRFPIDAVFLDREGTVMAVFHDVRPWRAAAFWKAHACLELASGTAAALQLRPGVRLPRAVEAA